MAPGIGHLQVGIIGQFTGDALARQGGQMNVGQQVVGSVPAATGSWPPGHAMTTIGQATGWEGSHLGGMGWQ